MPDLPNLPFDRTHINVGERLCAAVSGGADSVALLRALHQANNSTHSALGAGLSVVHIHHGIRGAEADADEAFVKDLCNRFDLPLHLHRVDIPARASASGETLEEAARTVRYEIFHSLLRSGEADSVLTAHTMDDQTETVLLKLLRGAWTEGLGGIHPVVTVPIPGKATGRILRPFLCLRRHAIEEYLVALAQLWREDSSNTDPLFTRNRLRHQLLPQLRDFNPSLDQTLSNLAELAREDEARWQAEVSRILPQLVLPGKPVRGGGPLDLSLRRRVLRASARQLGSRLSFPETSRLLALCGFLSVPTVPSKPGSSLRLSGGLRAERTVRELRLTRTPGA